MKMGLPARKMDEHYTYGMYATWPNEERWELIDGVAYNMSPAPSSRHQMYLGNLVGVFQKYFQGKPCVPFFAPFDVLFPAALDQAKDDVDTVVQPDLVVICDRSKIKPSGCLGAPDLCVEILSYWTKKKDIAEKFALYERSGVREYWIVDPADQTIELYGLEGQEEGKKPRYGEARYAGLNERLPTSIESAAFPGLIVDCIELFKEF
jgi:Uma2 family endonuclease